MDNGKEKFSHEVNSVGDASNSRTGARPPTNGRKRITNPWAFALLLTFIISVVILVVVLSHNSARRERIRCISTYTELMSIEDKLAFINNYRTYHQLPLLVSLSLGDAHMQEHNYKLAALEYARSARILQSGYIRDKRENSDNKSRWKNRKIYQRCRIPEELRIILLPRALSSQAVALYKLGNFEQSKQMLNDIIRNTTFHRTIRSNAGFLLLAMLVNDGKVEKANDLFKECSTLGLSVGLLQGMKNIYLPEDIQKTQ